MRDVIQDVSKWLEEGIPLAVATVVETWGSAPRSAGAHMAFGSTGELSGSVSGGCVEGSVIEAGFEVLKSGRPQLLKYGVSDANAWEVGLACGGTIEIFVEYLDPLLQEKIQEWSESSETFAIATVIAGPDDWLGSKVIVHPDGGTYGAVDNSMRPILTGTAMQAISDGRSTRRHFTAASENSQPYEIFVEVVDPAPTLVLVGGVHIAIALTRIARGLGYEIVVIDPRKAFGTKDRFVEADRLIQAWPTTAFKDIEVTKTTAVAILTHDPKIDDPAVIHALSTPAFYIGALGSRNTHRARVERLVDAGLPAAQIERLHAPIGVDIGASTPEEIALSIMAEIVSEQRSL